MVIMDEDLLQLLEKAVPDTHTLLDVVEEIERGEAQVWSSDGAILVTQVEVFPRQKVLHYWLAAGELGAVIELGKEVREWGRSLGCTKATISGRKGWERALRKEGWTPRALIMEQDL